MKYAHYNVTDGKLIGWYDSEIHTTIPTPNIEVSEVDWQVAIDNNYNYVDVTNNTLSKKDFRTVDEIFTQTKTSKATEITQAFNNAVEFITTALPHEMVSWRKQEDEARAYVADSTVSTPFIDAQVATRQLETKDELVAKIIANADAYQVAYASLLGKYQNLSNAVSVATTVAELNLIVW